VKEKREKAEKEAEAEVEREDARAAAAAVVRFFVTDALFSVQNVPICAGSS
jgi:hypothetical protein